MDAMSNNDDRKADRPKSSPFAYLPQFGGGEEVIHLFVCGDCRASSPYVRGYSLLTIIFLGHIVWREDMVMKCPGCMRRHILIRLPLAILLANILSPVIVAQWLFTFVKTFFSRSF